MAPRKRRNVSRANLKGPASAPQTSLDTHALNTCGFPALADEIYLEIISHIPSVPIPTKSFDASSYPETRRSRHETLLSLSQTSRSLRRFFWRYLWQRIEVREGMKIGDDDTLDGSPYLRGSSEDHRLFKKYAIELVRQLEIVSVRNPQLAQHVNYLDIFIGEYSIKTVLAELARCLILLPNLHTVQIDITLDSRRSLFKIFERTFKEYSYPQIRNVFVMSSSQSFIASCPQARRVGFTQQWALTRSCVHIIIDNCPRLEVLEDFVELIWRAGACKLVVDSLPNLRTIMICPLPWVEHAPHIDILQGLNHLQTIILFWKQPPMTHIPGVPHIRPEERDALVQNAKEDWIKTAKRFLIQIQLRDNLEKTLVLRDYTGERQILIKPEERQS